MPETSNEGLGEIFCLIFHNSNFTTSQQWKVLPFADEAFIPMLTEQLNDLARAGSRVWL